MSGRSTHAVRSSVKKYLLAGLLTIVPIWVTWLVIRFLLNLLRSAVGPVVAWLFRSLKPRLPWLADWLANPWFQTVMAIALILATLYVLGWLATHVIGKRLIALFDSLMDRIPLVKSLYGAVKKFLGTLQQKPDGVQRVVLINFPSPEMKTVGLVTRTLVDQNTGRELAVVYVPTTPNPTSGYLEIVPLEKLTSTDWTVEEAMTFIISGGAVARSKVHYDKGTDTPGKPVE